MRKVLSPILAIITFIVGVFLSDCLVKDSRRHPPADILADRHVSDLPYVSAVTRIDPPFNREIEKYAIYSAALTNCFIRKGDEFLVIDKEVGPRTSGGVTVEDSGLEIIRTKGLKRETFDDFRQRANEYHRLAREFDISVAYTLFSDNGTSPLLNEENGLKEFNDKHTHSTGLIELSNVGFSLDGNQAMVSVSTTNGPGCFWGFVILLNKVNGKWIVSTNIIVRES